MRYTWGVHLLRALKTSQLIVQHAYIQAQYRACERACWRVHLLFCPMFEKDIAFFVRVLQTVDESGLSAPSGRTFTEID